MFSLFLPCSSPLPRAVPKGFFCLESCWCISEGGHEPAWCQGRASEQDLGSAGASPSPGLSQHRSLTVLTLLPSKTTSTSEPHGAELSWDRLTPALPKQEREESSEQGEQIPPEHTQLCSPCSPAEILGLPAALLSADTLPPSPNIGNCTHRLLISRNLFRSPVFLRKKCHTFPLTCPVQLDFGIL